MYKEKDYRGPKKTDPDNLLSCVRSYYGLSQQHLADLCGLSSSLRSLQKLENGDFSVELGAVQSVAHLLDIPVHTLVHGTFEEVLPFLTAPIGSVQTKESFCKMMEASSEIGTKGENLVAEWERRKLAGAPYAKFVNTAPSNNPLLGFDVISATLDGKPLHIEVKTTTQACDRTFYMSIIEYNHMLDCMAKGITYELQRVYYVNDSSLCAVEVYTPEQLLEDFSFTARTYSVAKKVIAV